MVEQARLIKKYPNRRLYDTQTSTYITLVDVKGLVLEQEEFQVVDARTGEDLTHNILLHIIFEEETGGTPMFSSGALAQMIRFYGNAMQGMMGQYLESHINAFSEMQKKFQEQARPVAGDNIDMSDELWSRFVRFQEPAMQNMMGAYVDQSARLFQQMHDNVHEQTWKSFSRFHLPGHAQQAANAANAAEKK
jgi:polyhydroxyalkanoate synthesis repressor PhaR